MIQFNLLPDVKLEFLKAQKLKRSVVGIAIIAGGASLTLLILLAMAVLVFQKQHLNGLNEDIKKYTNQLKAVNDLDKVLTIQNQINSLSCTAKELQEGKKPCLHDKKPVTSRLFGYLRQVVPANVNISQLTVDMAQHTMLFTGNANSLNTVNKFVDTLKFTGYGTGNVQGDWTSGTTYKVDDIVIHNGQGYSAVAEHTAASDNEPGTGNNWKGNWVELPQAFTGVVLSTFGRADKLTTYSINLTFNPLIFDSSKSVKLIVPSTVTTRSEQQKPTDLFIEQPQPSTENNQQGGQ